MRAAPQMGKLERIVLLAALGLAAGSVAFLVSAGYEVLSSGFWATAFEATVRVPGTLVEKATSGEDADLFRGILLVNLAVFAGVVTLLHHGVRILLEGRAGSSGADEKELAADHCAEREKTHPKGARGWTLLRRAGDVLGRLARRGSADLKGFRDNRDPLGEGRSETSFLGRIRSVTMAAVADRVLDMEDRGTGDPAEDILDWYRDLKQSSGRNPELIERAVGIRKRFDDAARRRLAQKAPGNADFLLRMMDAWAARTIPGETRRAAGTDTAATAGTSYAADRVMLEAIRDVEDGTFPDGAAEQEGALDLEDTSGAEDDGVFGDEQPGGFEGEDPTTEEEKGATDSGDEDEDATEEDGGEFDETDDPDDGTRAGVVLAMEEIVSAIERLEEIIYEVQEEGGLWPGDIDGRSGAEGRINELFAALDKERVRLPDDWEERAENLSAGWIEIMGSEEGIEGRRNGLLELLGEEDEDDELAQSFLVGMSGSESDREENDERYGAFVKGTDEEVDEAEDGHVEAPEDGSQAVVLAEPERSAPRNLSAGDLKEVELCGDLLLRWGQVTRNSGASEAKAVHAVFEKEGVKRRVVGVLHLLARWRGAEIDETKQMGIVFRYLPDGEWHLRIEEGVWMVREDGDYVGVEARILDNEDALKSRIVIHFHGPGAPAGLLERRGGVIVSTRVMSVDEVRMEMGTEK